MSQSAVFVDSWAWIALSLRDDPDRPRAAVLARQVLDSGLGQVTSHLVLAESIARLRYDASWRIAWELIETTEELLAAGWLEVVTVDRPLWQDALTWFRRFDDQRFSMVDCTSFAIMTARGIREALTADRHFATAGFVPLGAV
ncbi:MAG: type II toxin-antitoxin system VapC family toxin [Fimbriimonadaceae bacterium]|nr:type II toxin-antitoxin system VapC family toxin [Fimbriimonadaceae bacterium]